MNTVNMLHLVLWSVQGFLALFFLASSIPKLIGRGLDRWIAFASLSRAQVVLIGIMELLGGAGLVLPMATGILPWLTPLDAIGLAIMVLMASGFHQRADERLAAIETGLWASIAAIIAIGRWNLVASHIHVPPWVLVAALGLLLPAAIITVIILWRRSGNSGKPEPVTVAVGPSLSSSSSTP